MIEIQTQMSERAVELLNLPEGKPCFLLDVGWVGDAAYLDALLHNDSPQSELLNIYYS